jgi:flavin-dependent dehydrogenase
MLCDAIVIGGGPAGATVGLLLARAGWRIAIIEKAEFPRRKVCGEFLSATNLPLLRELGIADAFLDVAGPEVCRVGVFCRDQVVTADMPRLAIDQHGWGHALGREHLDTLLLEAAAVAGATLWQPYAAVAVRGAPGAFSCTIASTRRAGSGVRADCEKTVELRAPVVIAGHGSWSGGALTSKPVRRSARRSDLLGFKARFQRSRLERGLMPLLAFDGGYGGMVHTDHDCVSFSCCIRRDRLEELRRERPGAPARDAVLAHLKRHCVGVGDALDRAELEPDSWRSAGPIKPGIRATRRGGVFLIGNAAGEAHPVVAEGISMAMQSSWLLAHRLITGDHTAAEYDNDWRRTFTWRIRAAAIVAHWAMQPAAVAVTIPLLRAFPLVLTESARTTGKVSALCSSSF